MLAERGPCFFVLVQAVDVDEVDFAVQVAAGDVAFEHGKYFAWSVFLQSYLL